MNDINIKYELSTQVSEEFEWYEWVDKIPYINFPERFDVKIVPPVGGAIVRFLIRDKKHKDAIVSVYLDCYEILGIYGEPYWEIYPDIDDSVYRCNMDNVEELIERIAKSIDCQILESVEEMAINQEPKFYTYRQNNSGGYFDVDDNVCMYVIIEARSAEHANEIAKNIGIYFDGCSKGIDCSCCGDRWSEQWEDDAGKNEPMIYGESVYKMREKCIIYYLDGRKERIESK